MAAEKVLKGKKIPVKEQGKLDKSKMGFAVLRPPDREVEGQVWYWRRVACPYCGFIQTIWYDTELFHWYTCINCAGVFRM